MQHIAIALRAFQGTRWALVRPPVPMLPQGVSNRHTQGSTGVETPRWTHLL